MLSGRVAQPLVGLARLIEDYEEVADTSLSPERQTSRTRKRTRATAWSQLAYQFGHELGHASWSRAKWQAPAFLILKLCDG